MGADLSSVENALNCLGRPYGFNCRGMHCSSKKWSRHWTWARISNFCKSCHFEWFCVQTGFQSEGMLSLDIAWLVCSDDTWQEATWTQKTDSLATQTHRPGILRICWHSVHIQACHEGCLLHLPQAHLDDTNYRAVALSALMSLSSVLCRAYSTSKLEVEEVMRWMRLFCLRLKSFCLRLVFFSYGCLLGSVLLMVTSFFVTVRSFLLTVPLPSREFGCGLF